MKQIKCGYQFRDGSRSCAFRIEEGDEGVTLIGEEWDGGAAIFCSTLSFSPYERNRAESFVRILAESKTHPRMMIELAEEYFSSASFE